MPGSMRAVFAGMLLAVLSIFGLACGFLLDFEECTDSSACATKHGRGWMCASDKLCIRGSLLDSEGPCATSKGPINDPNVFNIGVILPLSGPEGGDGQAMLLAIELAQDDFNALSGVNGHPIGLIICDSKSDNDLALSASEHLVYSAGVEAIIGPNSSSQTVAAATQHTIANDVLLVSPSATALSVTNLNDKDLVWRTTISDAIQAYAMGLFVTDLMDQKQAEQPGEQPIKLAILSRQDDVYAQGLRDLLLEHLPETILNAGDDRYIALNYPNDSAGQGSDYSGVVANLSTQRTKPDVVVILGFDESWTIARQLDAELNGTTRYVLADAGRIADEAKLAISDALEGRILGTAVGTPGLSYQPWNAFRIKFNAASTDKAENMQYVANAYDALYAIALAAAGNGFTGPELAKGMAKLSDPSNTSRDIIFANQSGAQAGMLARSQGKSINLHGASGILSFDSNGDLTIGEIALWCLLNRRVPVASDTALVDTTGKYNAISCPEDTCTADTDCPTDHHCSTANTCDPL